MLKKYVFCLLLFGNGLTDFDVQYIKWLGRTYIDTCFPEKYIQKKVTKKVTKTGQQWHFSCFLACFRLCLKMAKTSVKNKVKSRRKLKINKKMLRPIGYSMISNNVWKKKKNWENNVKAGGVFLKKRIGTQKFFLNNSQKKKKKKCAKFFLVIFLCSIRSRSSKVQSPKSYSYIYQTYRMIHFMCHQ